MKLRGDKAIAKPWTEHIIPFFEIIVTKYGHIFAAFYKALYPAYFHEKINIIWSMFFEKKVIKPSFFVLTFFTTSTVNQIRNKFA